MTSLRGWMGMAALVAASGLSYSHSDDPAYAVYPRKNEPRPKSKHKRKFKGSKAAKKASRRKS